MVSHRQHLKRPSHLSWWRVALLLVCGLVMNSSRADASCGDYVHVGNPRFAMTGEHSADEGGGFDFKGKARPASERPCDGIHCRPVQQDSQVPPTRIVPVERTEACLLGLVSVDSGIQGNYLSLGTQVREIPHVSQGLFRPPRDA